MCLEEEEGQEGKVGGPRWSLAALLAVEGLRWSRRSLKGSNFIDVGFEFQ